MELALAFRPSLTTLAISRQTRDSDEVGNAIIHRFRK
jgi:hypothetical protein